MDCLLGHWIERGITVLYQLPPECVICKSIGGYNNSLEDMLHLIRVYLGDKRMLRPHCPLLSILIGGWSKDSAYNDKVFDKLFVL